MKNNINIFSHKVAAVILGIVLYVFSFSLALDAKTNSHQQVLFKCKLVGYSMFPAIKSGETIIYKKVDAGILKKGDIIVYRDSSSGEQVCHRVDSIEEGLIRAKGDNNRFCDQSPVSNKNLLGKVTHVNGRTI